MSDAQTLVTPLEFKERTKDASAVVVVVLVALVRAAAAAWAYSAYPRR